MATTHKEREESLKIAKGKDILSVAQSLGMNLIQQGRSYHWNEHDSLVINPQKNLFFWNSRQVGGSVIDLVMQIKEVPFKEAVSYLNEIDADVFKETQSQPKKAFHYYVEEHSSLDETINYLTKERQLSPEVVDFFISKGSIAQGTYRDKENNHEETAIVFKHRDLTNKIQGVSFQGVEPFPEIHEPRDYLKRTYGDGFYGFNVDIGHIPKGTDISEERPLKIIAFEAPIDLMSFYELNQDKIQDTVLLSMNGLRKGSVSTYLANAVGANIKESEKSDWLKNMEKLSERTGKTTSSIQVTLAVDNDESGKKLIESFDTHFIQVDTLVPTVAGKDVKDWNDVLKHQKSQGIEKEVVEMERLTSNDLTNDVVDYLEIEFNETNPEMGLTNLTGSVVTQDLIEQLKQWDSQLATTDGYFKVYFNDVEKGEVIDHFRLDLGDGASANQEIYDYLQDKVVEINEKDISLLSKEPLTKENQPIRIPYVISFQREVEESINQMAKEVEGTHHYLTESDVQALLDTHFSKIEGLIQHFNQTQELLPNGTNQEKAAIQKGLFATISEVLKEFKADLKERMTQRKEAALFNVTDKANNLRLFFKNGFNRRLLTINQKIRNLIDKLDVRFAIEEKRPRVTEDKEEVSETVIVDKVVEKKELIEEVDQPLISLAKEYALLVTEEQTLSESILEAVSGNSLTDVSQLQQQLKAKQEQLKSVKEEIDKKRLVRGNETIKPQELSNLTELVKQRDQLLEERNKWVSHPDFLNVPKHKEEGLTPLEHFKQVDSQLQEIEKDIGLIEKGDTKEIEPTQSKTETMDKTEQVNKESTSLSEEDVLLAKATKAAVVSEVVKEVRPMVQPNEEAIQSIAHNEVNGTTLTNQSLLNEVNFKSYLESATKFHSYSANNVQLIREQSPDATQLASENKWNQLGATIREGAEPFQVYAPKFTDKLNHEGQVLLDDKGEPIQEISFYLKDVYDISQTTYVEMKKEAAIDLSDGKQFKPVFDGIKEVSHVKDISIEAIPETSQRYPDKLILQEGMGVEQTLRTMIQEVVSDSKYLTTTNPEQREFEVSCVTQMVCHHLGIIDSQRDIRPTDIFSDSPQSLKEFNQSLSKISKEASQMIKSVESKLTKEQSKQLSPFEERVRQGQVANEKVNQTKSTEQTMSKRI